jgi:glycosyltransferase involved in cell wall biosynthesis
MLNIALDVTALRPYPSGVGYYIANLVKALTELQTQENFQLNLYYQPSLKNWLKGNFSAIEQIANYPYLFCLPIPTTISNLLSIFPNPLLGYWETYLKSPDIIHGLDHIVYPCQNSLRVMTIHDLTFIKYPQYSPAIVKTYTARIKRCLAWTDLIITMTENTKRDIIHYLDFPAEKISVIPLASRYSETSYSSNCDFNFPHPYLLFVGTLEPRKNIENIVLAFNHLKKNYSIPHHLVLIGKKGWKYNKILRTISNSPYQNYIHHLDYLADDLVVKFYENTTAFIYPSHYEGFGLPVLEAMTLGTPVITSSTSSLPEVVGDAAVTVNPQDYLELATEIYRVISQPNLQEELRDKGKSRAKLFSWEQTARQTLQAYKSIL